jgi:protein Hikeshi
MFGIILSGRPLLTEPTTIHSPTQVTFAIPSQPAFNHLVIFLLPDSTLPPGTAAAVYIQFPSASSFTLLGALTPEKPSAIFATKGIGGAPTVEDVDAMVDSTPAGAAAGQGGGEVVTIGVSLEPVEQVSAALQARKAAGNTGAISGVNSNTQLVRVAPGAMPPSAVTTKVLAQRIIGNAFNFLASFGSDVIPLKAFEEWWKKFERKVEVDPTFLEREGGGE